MDQAGRQELLNRIISGKLFHHFRDEFFIYFEDPDISLLAKSDAVHSAAIKKYKDTETMLSPEEAKQISVKEGLWSRADDLALQKQHNLIRSNRMQIAKNTYNKKLLRTILYNIESCENEINKLERKRHYLDTVSYAYHAELDRRKFIVRSIVRDLPEEMWDQANVANDLVTFYYEQTMIPEKTMRDLARNHPWRSMWRVSCKTGSDILSRPAAEMTDLQARLCQWSLYYDNVFESPERPSEEIIDNDYLLDNWFDDQNKKQKASSVGPKGPNSRFWDAGTQEVFIPADREGAKEVYALNDENARKRIKQRQRFVEQSGRSVKEGELPDVRRDAQMQLNRMATERGKRNG